MSLTDYFLSRQVWSWGRTHDIELYATREAAEAAARTEAEEWYDSVMAPGYVEEAPNATARGYRQAEVNQATDMGREAWIAAHSEVYAIEVRGASDVTISEVTRDAD